jgi:hypothetical protein
MAWLTPKKSQLAAMAGYSDNAPRLGEALAFAEEVIARRTGAVWGSTTTFYQRVRLNAKSWLLPLPVDVAEVESVVPEQAATLTPTPHGLALVDSVGQDVLWLPGGYVIHGTRGFTEIPKAVLKAASLLINYYMGLSDSERSRYENFSSGDFSGALRRAAPVPEAEQLLKPYCQDVGVSLASPLFTMAQPG